MSVSAFILERQAYAAGDRQRREEVEDLRRLDFLKRLDDAPFEVTDWEARFLNDLLQRCARLPFPRFSEGQRTKIDELSEEYGCRLDGVRGLTSAATSLPAAEPGKCAWLVIADGRQQRCNLDALKTGHKGMPLCLVHYERQAEAMKRAKERRFRR